MEWGPGSVWLEAREFHHLAHFPVSSAMSLPKSAGEPENTVTPRSARRALILGLARPALISLLVRRLSKT